MSSISEKGFRFRKLQCDYREHRITLCKINSIETDSIDGFLINLIITIVYIHQRLVINFFNFRGGGLSMHYDSNLIHKFTNKSIENYVICLANVQCLLHLFILLYVTFRYKIFRLYVKCFYCEFPFIINAHIGTHKKKKEENKEVFKDIKFLELMKGNKLHFKNTIF